MKPFETYTKYRVQLKYGLSEFMYNQKVWIKQTHLISEIQWRCKTAKSFIHGKQSNLKF